MHAARCASRFVDEDNARRVIYQRESVIAVAARRLVSARVITRLLSQLNITSIVLRKTLEQGLTLPYSWCSNL